MSDRRLTPFSGRFALEALRGTVAAEFTPGAAARVVVPVADLCAAPGALRDRQVIYGADVTVIERRDGHAFVQAAADGYCGWVMEAALEGEALAASHVVASAATHAYREASIKRGEAVRLSLGSRLAVRAFEGMFAVTEAGFVPACHLRPITAPEADPVAVAERFLGTPYLWGGNSRDGIDCSGLVQAALTACGIECAGDTDLQVAQFGAFLPEGTIAERGDLFFWRGHVAMACDGARLIHANGHSMSVAYEPIAECLARIAAAGEGTFYGIKRP